MTLFKPPYVELAHSVKTHLGVRPLGHRRPLPVYGFGLAGGHPLPPPHHIRPIPVAGIVTLPFGLVPGQPHRRIHTHSSLLQSGDVLTGGKAPVHQVGVRAPARPPEQLLLHGRRLPCSVPDDVTPTHDDSVGAIGGQFHIVGWPEAAIRHLYHPCLGVCGGHPCLGDLAALSAGGVLLAFLLRLCPGRKTAGRAPTTGPPRPVSLALSPRAPALPVHAASHQDRDALAPAPADPPAAPPSGTSSIPARREKMPRRRSTAPASRLEPHAPSGPRQRPSRSLGQKVTPPGGLRKSESM